MAVWRHTFWMMWSTCCSVKHRRQVRYSTWQITVSREKAVKTPQSLQHAYSWYYATCPIQTFIIQSAGIVFMTIPTVHLAVSFSRTSCTGYVSNNRREINFFQRFITIVVPTRLRVIDIFRIRIEWRVVRWSNQPRESWVRVTKWNNY